MTYKNYDGNVIVDPGFPDYIHGNSLTVYPKNDIAGQVLLLKKTFLIIPNMLLPFPPVGLK